MYTVCFPAFIITPEAPISLVNVRTLFKSMAVVEFKLRNSTYCMTPSVVSSFMIKISLSVEYVYATLKSPRQRLQLQLYKKKKGF
jgi:hypothetical protein